METHFSSDAWDDYLYWQATDKKIVKRINELLKEACRTPFSGKGKPEPLRHDLQGCWSRRIDQEHRMVYRADATTLTVFALRFHY